MSKRSLPVIFRFLLALLGLWVAFELAAHLTGEILWFQEVNYLPTFRKRLLWQGGLFGVTSSLSLAFLVSNLRLSHRLKWQATPSPRTSPDLPLSPAQSRPLKLPWLLVIVLGFNLVIGLLVLYYSQVAFAVWTPDFNLPAVTPPLPSPFAPSALSQFLPQLSRHLWQLGLVVGISLLLLINSQVSIEAIAWGIGLVFGAAMAGNWTRILKYLNTISFSQSDPQFHRDISFYVFKLPFWQLVDFWLGGLFLYGLIAVSLTYLLSADSLSQGKFPGFSRPQLRHLSSLGSLMMAILALGHWLNRYELLYSQRGVSYGASYADVHVQLPLETILAVLSLAIAGWLAFQAGRGFDRGKGRQWRRRGRLPRFPLSPFPFYCYLAILMVGLVASEAVQYLNVQPNELAREQPYIERSIAFTRAAFNLDKIEADTFAAAGNLTAGDLARNRLTIDNIRLWDTRPLLKTNRQLQEIRLYYKFPDADIDRYTIQVQPENSSLKTAKQQVLIAARELNYREVPPQAQTWVNEHLVYTHGYGFTLSPVNLVDRGGLPYYFVRDIGTDTEEGALQTSNERIQASIPIKLPRIYYGELTDTYVMTNTRVKELDFPKGQDNAYNTYDGRGGIRIGTWWRRLLFAEYLKDWQMLFTRDFTADTRLLLRRNINRRLREIAPFLRYDRNPYLVAARGEDTNQAGIPSNLYWLVDAYLTSDAYPYSDPGERNFNYIRNSVKIAIDAYNGHVDFYIADASDPIVQSWNQIFPELFKPLAAMPGTLRSHIRYPEDLFSTQSERLLTYHMRDPRVFYNREDQWRIPQEIYGTETQPIAPYYLIMKLPGKTVEEFILFHVYTPTSRNNLIAGLFAQSDGKNYGKLVLFELPKQKLIYGPEQIEALINQDPQISQQISLWNREGSRVIQGNLLVIPIEESLLYVEPLYLEATENSLPTLVRVIVAYENQIVMAETLPDALQAIFEPNKSPSSAIIRELEKEAIEEF